MRRLLAIGFVWVGCTVGWAVLGSSLLLRTGELDGSLTQEVHALWGPPHVQRPPSGVGRESHVVREKVVQYDDRKRQVVSWEDRTVTTEEALFLDATEVAVRIDLQHRRKGLLWFPTYGVEFQGRYLFRNTTGEGRRAEIVFPLERGSVVYDGFEVRDASGAAVATGVQAGLARWLTDLAPGEGREYTVAYRSRGTGSWRYGEEGKGLAGAGGRAERFRLALHANFAEVDFPPGTLSPTEHGPRGAGWRGEWRFASILSAAVIGLEMPRRLNPGPLAARITFFAPVGLLFFFFVVAILTQVRRRAIHPMNYFLFGCGFFAFHLLFAYLIDHLPVGPSFALAAAVSMALVVSYARLFLGWRVALRVMGLAQVAYLVLFSLTFFWRGFTGLAVAVGAVLTLFLVMQMTGRVDWERAGRGPEPAGAAGPTA